MRNVTRRTNQSIRLLTSIPIVRTQVLLNPNTIRPQNLADNLTLKHRRQLCDIIAVGSRYHNRQRYPASVAKCVAC